MHTPTPWTIGNSCDGFLTITDGSKTICTVGAADIFDGIEEDAALIVKAVNSYEAMREALIAARSSLYNVPEVGKRYDQQHSDTHMRACLAIDRALALAEGKE